MTRGRTNAQRGYRFKQRRRAGGNQSAPKRLSLHSCTTCGKQCFETRHIAKVSAGRIAPGVQLRLYQCNGFWHHTSVPADTMATYREKDHRRGIQGREADTEPDPGVSRRQD